MDLNISTTQRSEIEQFLFDVRDHFRASLETSEYENTSNIFYMTAAAATENLLHRCDRLLKQYTMKQQTTVSANSEFGAITTTTTTTTTRTTTTTANNGSHSSLTRDRHEDASYLDMTAKSKKKSTSVEYMDFNSSDKTFRCSTTLNGKKCYSSLSLGAATDEESNETDTDDNDDNSLAMKDTQIYDICNVSQLNADDERHKVFTPDLELTQTANCPYIDLPAGHLAIQQSSKYGQLQRIEKRLFFDQSKKCYCGILNDWLLCYADGPTSSRPNISLHLKQPSIEIEHSGEGKRREICFQITTADPNKKFVFQANNEVDAKEWIHAIEAAIRGDTATVMKNARKLPTPPILKKLNFVSSTAQDNRTDHADGIYEEPSPLYDVHEPTELLATQTVSERSAEPLPELPDQLSLAEKFEYDIPKCPPQPLQSRQIESESADKVHSHEANATSALNGLIPNKSILHGTDKVDFQAIVKDVHGKLSSHLSIGPSAERLKKATKKAYSCNANEFETLTFSSTTPNKEQKKQKKPNTPNASPQKHNNGNSTDNNNTNSNNTHSHSSIEKVAKNWFLNRLNKTTSSMRNSTTPTPTKCKQSEKENLLGCQETVCENYEGAGDHPQNGSGGGGGKSKVNMIINQFEASGHFAMSMFCDNDCNNYEPIMTVSSTPGSFMKKV